MNYQSSTAMNGTTRSFSSFGKLFFRIFLGVGILLLVLALVIGGLHYSRSSRYVEAAATIVQVSEDGGTTVRYLADGEAVIHHFSSYSSSYQVGERIRVAFDPDHPQKAVISGTMGYLAPIILGGMSLIFGGIGIVGLHIVKKWNRSEEENDRTRPRVEW